MYNEVVGNTVCQPGFRHAANHFLQDTGIDVQIFLRIMKERRDSIVLFSFITPLKSFSEKQEFWYYIMWEWNDML